MRRAVRRCAQGLVVRRCRRAVGRVLARARRVQRERIRRRLGIAHRVRRGRARNRRPPGAQHAGAPHVRFTPDGSVVSRARAATQSALARCFLCAWYNEMHARSERDQLSFSYTMAAMGLTPDVHAATSHATPAAPNATAGAMRVPDAGGGIYVWPRNEHWRAPAETGRPKPWRYVQYVGHGGPGDDSTAASPAAAVHRRSRAGRTRM